MIHWRNDKPFGAIILVKLTEDFTFRADVYDVLYRHKARGFYYDAAGDEIPVSAMEKWALVKEI